MLSYLLWGLAVQNQIVLRVGVAGTYVVMYEYRTCINAADLEQIPLPSGHACIILPKFMNKNYS